MSRTIPAKPRPRPVPANDVAQPIAVRSGKVLSLLIALEALRQNSHALGAHSI
jgi:hypothetical protein